MNSLPQLHREIMDRKKLSLEDLKEIQKLDEEKNKIQKELLRMETEFKIYNDKMIRREGDIKIVQEKINQRTEISTRQASKLCTTVVQFFQFIP